MHIEGNWICGGRILAVGRGAHMRGDALAAMEDFDRARDDAQRKETKRNRVPHRRHCPLQQAEKPPELPQLKL